MLGIGESDDEIRDTMRDLLNAGNSAFIFLFRPHLLMCVLLGVEILTLGQYLRPTSRHLKVSAVPLTRVYVLAQLSRCQVQEYVEPTKFDMWKEEGEAMGFRYVASGPLVRSSYRAGEFFLETMIRDKRKMNVPGEQTQL